MFKRHIFILLATLVLLLGCDYRSGVEVGFNQYSGWGNGPYVRIKRDSITVYNPQSQTSNEGACPIEEDFSALIDRWVSLVPAEYDDLSAIEFLGDCADEARREVSIAWWRGEDTFRRFSVRWSLTEECRPSAELPGWVDKISDDIDRLQETIKIHCEDSDNDT